MNVAVEPGGRIFLLRPDREEGAVWQFGEGGIADRPAAHLFGTISQQCGLAPGDAFVA